MAKRKKKKRLPDVTKYNPVCMQPTNNPTPPDEKTGLPAMYKFNAASKQGRGQLWGQIHEEPMRSRKIADKINDRLSSELVETTISADDTLDVFNEMVYLSSNGFQSKEDFRTHLTEGSLVGITKLASTYIGLPYGEYVVWNITPQSAVLMPVEQTEDLFTESPKPVEIHMNHLLAIWDKATRAITEDDKPFTGYGQKERTQKSKSKYPRDSKVVGAIEASGESQEDLASACGIEPSQVSRIKNKSGEGSRNPSLPVAVCMAKHLGKGVEEIFSGGKPSKKRHKSNSGAGKGTGSPYQKGNG